MRQHYTKWAAALASAGLVLLCACTPRSALRLDPPYQQSNQALLQQLVMRLGIPDTIRTTVPAGSSIALASLETAETTDHPIVVLVEDSILRLLAASEYRLLERDADALHRLINEQSGDRYRMVPPSYGTVGDSILVTQLEGADYLLSYRVLECGVVYRGSSTKEFVQREGLLMLHIRVQDARTGRLVQVQDLASSMVDEIDSHLAGQLADFHYSFYPQGLPLVRGASEEPPVAGRTIPQEGTAPPAPKGRTFFSIVLTTLGALAIAAIARSGI